MGTRGTTGFRLNGQDKVAYQQFDSYPDGVGKQVVEDLKELLPDLLGLKEKVKAARVVTNQTPPTPEDIEKLRAVTDLEVSNQSTNDWYCLVRQTQGMPKLILDCGYILDSASFMHESLFCEFGYIINLDDLVLEFYKGFQQSVGVGRYAQGKTGKKYQGVTLALSIPFSDVQTKPTDELVKLMNKAAGMGDDEDEQEADGTKKIAY